MKVVHVITGLGQGGAEAMLEKLILAARRLDPNIEHAVISLGEIGPIGARLLDAGIPVECMAITASPAGLLKLPQLVRSLRRAGPDSVVQTWLWYGDLLGGLAARLAGLRRVVWNLRNSVPRGPSVRMSSLLAARLCALLSRSVPSRIICNAQAGMDAHCAIGYDSAKCEVIPNGFDMDRFRNSLDGRDALRRHWNVKPGQFLIGMVARMDPLKDHKNFVLAAAHAAAHTAVSIRFVLVGDGVPESTELRRQIADVGLSDQFILEGHHKDVPAVMSALDGFCLSSKSEGFPNVLGEAMACQIPCITTDVGDTRMVLGDDQWIVCVGDSLALGSKMLALAVLPIGERLELGQRQRARIANQFGIDRIWQRYRDLYETL